LGQSCIFSYFLPIGNGLLIGKATAPKFQPLACCF